MPSGAEPRPADSARAAPVATLNRYDAVLRCHKPLRSLARSSCGSSPSSPGCSIRRV